MLFSKWGLFQWPSTYTALAQVELSSIPSAFHHSANTKRGPPTENRKKKALLFFDSIKHLLKLTWQQYFIRTRTLCCNFKNQLPICRETARCGTERAPRGWRAFDLVAFLSGCVRLVVFEISSCHVLCEKQPSQPCRAIDLDQSEQVLAIINKHCGPVFCDRKFKLKTPTTTRAQQLHNGEVVSRYGLPHSYLQCCFWWNTQLCFSCNFLTL